MGVHTGKDSGVIAVSRDDLLERFAAYFDPAVSHTEMGDLSPGLMESANEFTDPAAFRVAMQRDPEANDPAGKIRPYVYRPLDTRWIWYETKRRVFATNGEAWSGCLVQRYGEELSAAIRLDNAFLCVVSQARRRSETRPMVACSLVDLHLYDRGVTCIPVSLISKAGSRAEPLLSGGERVEPQPVANLSSSAWESLSQSWRFRAGLRGDAAKVLVRQLFFLTLAVGHSPQFEADHQSALSQDWLHLPIPKDRAVLAEIAALGETVSLLLDPLADAARPLKELLGPARRTLAVVSSREADIVREGELVVTVSYYGAAAGRWEERAPAEGEAAAPAWGQATGDLWLNDTIHLKNVPEGVWGYELGGYPVVKKWLGYRDEKRRPERGLTLAELDHLREIVHRLAALLLLHERLDAAYERAIVDPFSRADLGFTG
jgi:hypothetical protein